MKFGISFRCLLVAMVTFIALMRANCLAALQSQESAPERQMRGEIPPIHGKAGGRPMVPKDLFAMPSYDAKVLSPDGNMVAVVVHRTAPGAASGDLWGLNHRCELWVIELNGGPRKLLTSKEPVKLSQWDPVWSPDSQRLAFLSSEGEDNAFLEIWDRASGQMQRVSTSGIDIDAVITKESGEGSFDGNALVWLDNQHLMSIVLPKSLHSHEFDDDRKSIELASEGVKSAAAGVEPTAIVASSPPDQIKESAPPVARLVIFNTKTGNVRDVGELPASQARDSERDVVISPDGNWAAINLLEPAHEPLSLETSPPSADLFYSGRIGVIRLAAQASGVRWLGGIRSGHAIVLDWQPDSSQFIFAGHRTGNKSQICVAAVNTATGEWHPLAELKNEQLSNDGELIHVIGLRLLPEHQVALRIRNVREGGDLRNTWWAVTDDRAMPLALNDPRLTRKSSAETKESIKFETSGTGRLFTEDAAGHEETLFPEVAQLAAIEEPRYLELNYTALDGSKQYAELILPYGYVPGTKYPTVVWVYAGDVNTGPNDRVKRDEDSFLNLMLLTGHGYAVLIPSMPLSPTEVPSDPMLHLNDGVDPAVDRAIALGVADPDRLALFGHSYGGYSVFGLVTETHRYRAAVASSGLSDLSAMYLDFDARYRYDHPNEAAFAPYSTESGQFRMGVPLWSEPDRYIRNSPVFAADKIDTPLLFIDGALDIGEIQNQEMFTALNRQGKRAEYVCYLGENHFIKSPANILDMWDRIFKWLDSYVKNPELAGK